MSKFATFASKLCEPVANSSEQTANQNTNIAAEVWKVARKRTSGLTVKPFMLRFVKKLNLNAFYFN